MNLTRLDMLHVSLGILLTVGCASHPPFPQSSLTGKIVEVKIADALSPTEIRANPGDEVRWRNTTGVLLDLYFVEPLNDRIACELGFTSTGWGYLFESSEAQYIVAAVVHPNQFVSLCFSSPGTYAYIAKKETTPTGKSIRMTGTVIIHQVEPDAIREPQKGDGTQSHP
jgi:plastocyanin